MRKLVILYYAFFTLILPVSGIGLAYFSNKNNSYDASACTRYCHNAGNCKHDPVLPDYIAGDDGYYGNAIDALFSLGDKLAAIGDLTRFEGYGLANILVFCIIIPLLHFVFMAITFYLISKKGKK